MNFRSFFQTRSEPLIGLDIGPASLHWVELSPDGAARLRLERCAVEPLAPGCIEQGHIERFEEVAAALQRLARTAGSRQRRVALAMPATAMEIRQVRFTRDLSPADLERQVQAEVLLHGGLLQADLALDYGVLPPVAGAGTDQQIWIATAARTMLQDRLGLAESAGLLPVIVDGQTQACARAARQLWRQQRAAHDDSLAALFQLTTQACSLQLMDRLKVLHESAVWAPGPENAATLSQRLATELAQHAQGQGRVKLIMLAGDAQATPGLSQALADATGCDCVWADPLAAMSPGNAQARVELPPSARAGLMTACGLALRRFADAC